MATYKAAVEWIALNDEGSETDAEVIATLISVAMVADLWKKDPMDVAKAVLKARAKNSD